MTLSQEDETKTFRIIDTRVREFRATENVHSRSLKEKNIFYTSAIGKLSLKVWLCIMLWPCKQSQTRTFFACARARGLELPLYDGGDDKMITFEIFRVLLLQRAIGPAALICQLDYKI